MFVERLKSSRKEAGLTQKEIAKKLFISQQAYAKYETGLVIPNVETLAKISDILKVPADFLLGRTTHLDAPPSTGGVWIPVLGNIAAGMPIEAIEEVLDWEEIPQAMANSGEYFALRIKGESMEPKISDGDVVIIKRQPCADTGDTVAVIVNGESATVKKIKHTPEGMMLIPSNPAFEPMFYTNKEIETLPVSILGKVVELRAKF